MNKWVLIGGFAVAPLVAAACDSPLPTSFGLAGSTGGNPTAGSTGGRGPAVLEDAGGEAAAPDAGLIPMPDGSVELAPACWFSTIEPEPVALAIVVDVSSSMNLAPPGGTDSKWNITRDALLDAVGSLRESTVLGVEFFPNMPTGASAVPQPPTACVDQAGNVDLAPLGPAGSLQRGAIGKAFSSLTIPPDCGTPTLDAYRLALAPMAETSLPPDKFLLLVTDGQPTYAGGCVGDGTPTSDPATLQALTDPIVAEIGNAFASGSRTFVIGLPGSDEGSTTGFDTRAWLSEAASAGGTALAGCSDTGSPSFCHFDLATSENLGQDLGDVLAKISLAIVSCKYRVPQPDGGVVDVSKLDLLYQAGDGARYLVVRNLASNCQLGWHFTDDTKTQMEICGSTCDQIKSDPGAQVELIFACFDPWLW